MVGDNMNEKKIVKSKFDFLIELGFSYSNEKTSYICFTMEYQKGNIIIIPGYDYREHDFDVCLLDINNKNENNLHTSILDTNIGTFEGRRILEQTVKNIFENSKKYNYGMPKKYFEAIVTVYADFVKANLNDILDWKYDISNINLLK